MYRIYLSIFFLIFSVNCIAKDITIDEVYQQIFRINEEIEILKRHFNIDEILQVAPIYTNFTSLHTWQKSYEISFKLNILREKHHLPFLATASLEPSLEARPQIVFAQARRILTEIEIIKYQLDITEMSAQPPTFTGKTLADNFNLMNHISYQIDLLTGSSFTPSYVFSQAMRISEDINIILDELNIQDNTIPPPKQNGATPADSFKTALQLLREIRRLEQLENIEGIDIHPFEKIEKITPSEVFGIAGIVLAELQRIKADLRLFHALTPIALHYEDKTPSDVQQIFGWCVRGLQLITMLAANKTQIREN